MSEERKFGLAATVFLLVLAGLAWLKHRPLVTEVSAACAVVLLIVALVFDPFLFWPRRWALTFGGLIGRINTAIFLSIVYFFILAPVGFALKLFGRDELRRRKPVPGTMWIPYGGRTRDPKHFEKMF